jgi:hypothetical protein
LSNCFSKSDKSELRSDEEKFEFFVRFEFSAVEIVEDDIAANDEMKIEMI